MYRRDFVFSATTTILASTALSGSVIAEEAAATVHAITAAHRRLDGPTSSRDLAEPVVAHLRLSGHMQAKIEDPCSCQAMAAAVSEVAGLVGWLSWDMHDLGAVDEGIALIRHAATALVGERPATAEDPSPWPWVFPFDTGKIATHRLTCAVRLPRPDVAYPAVADLPAPMTAGHRKQGALALLDLACAHVQAQEVEEGLRVATAAIDLAATTQSERVLSRARQFRRTIPATVPPAALRDVDEHLRIANTRESIVR